MIKNKLICQERMVQPIIVAEDTLLAPFNIRRTRKFKAQSTNALISRSRQSNIWRLLLASDYVV